MFVVGFKKKYLERDFLPHLGRHAVVEVGIIVTQAEHPNVVNHVDLGPPFRIICCFLTIIDHDDFGLLKGWGHHDVLQQCFSSRGFRGWSRKRGSEEVWGNVGLTAVYVEMRITLYILRKTQFH